MRTEPQFSFIRSLRNAIKTGTLIDEDLIFSNEIERRVQSTESLRFLRGAGLPAGARSFFCPVNFARRDVTTAPGSGAGIVDKSYLQFSDLLSYSTALAQGAQTINNAIGTAYLGMVSSLPSPTWVAEAEPIGDTDPTFAGAMIEPKRISGKVIVSSLLLSMSPGGRLDQRGLGPKSIHPIGSGDLLWERQKRRAIGYCRASRHAQNRI